MLNCRLLISLCKQFGTRSGLTSCRAGSGSKLFDTLMVFLKEFLEEVGFEKSAEDKKIMKNFPGVKVGHVLCTERKRPDVSSTMQALSGAHCTDARLYTLQIMIGTTSMSAREHSHC